MIEDVPAAVGPAIIVATGRNLAIGRRGTLPWHFPEDLAHFKRATLGRSVVLGATTWASIGRPLPGRRLIVVSSRDLDLPDGVSLAPSPQAALGRALETDEAPLIAGGATIYAALMDEAVRIIETTVDVDVPDADSWFPTISGADWTEVAAWQGEDGQLAFRVLDRG